VVVPAINKTVLTDRDKTQLISDIYTLSNDTRLTAVREQPAVCLSDRNCRDYVCLIMSNPLHGIDSPRRKMSIWENHPLWGRWRHVSFNEVLRLCFETIGRARITSA